MKALIIYDSVFGNTEKIAQAIDAALAAQGSAETLPASQATAEKLHGVELLIVGSPTRSFRPTEAITKFLGTLSKNELNGVRAAAFDTRFSLPDLESSARRSE